MAKEAFDRTFEVKPKGLKDIDEVADFISKYYTSRVPIRKIFRVADHDEGLYNYDMRRIEESLKHDCAVGCHEKSSGKLVAMLFGIVHDKRVHPNQRSESICGEGAAKKRFSAWMTRDLYQTLKTDKFVMLGLSVVHPDYTGFGITFHLLPVIESIAFEKGCEHLVGLAISRFVQNISEKLGHSMLREVKYEDYVDPLTGLKPDLNLSPIHTHAKLYYRKLESKTEKSKL